jgi:RNA recognition motif-containing protein
VKLDNVRAAKMIFAFQPYTAYVANLSYDIDEADVVKFFSKLKIKGVRLPRDGDADTGRLKGFGYADFEDRDSLVEALSMNDLLLKNRCLILQRGEHLNQGDRTRAIYI